MSTPFQIVVCGSFVPDPLQTLEPVAGPSGPALKNEMMLPAVLDPWAGHALFEAANLAQKTPGSKVWLVSLGAKAKLQQVMMTVAQKAPFELVALDGPASGFADSFETAAALAGAIEGIAGLDRARLLLFGGWESASRGAGSTMQMVAERLGITEQFQGVDQIAVRDDGSFEVLERVEGGRHQVSVCSAPPALLGWATGNLPEPRNNPQVGMANMRTVMPALQRAKAAPIGNAGLAFASVTLPKQQRQTRIVKDMPAERSRAKSWRGWGRNNVENDSLAGAYGSRWIAGQSGAGSSRHSRGAGRRLDRRTGGRGHAGCRRPDCRLRRGALPGGDRRGVRTAALRHRRGRRGSPLPRGGLSDCNRRGHLAMVARPAGSGLPFGRARGHARHQSRAGRRRTGGDALVLPSAHGSGAVAHAASVVRAARSRVRRRLEQVRPGAAAVEQVSVAAPATRTTVTGYQAPKADEQTIRPDAKMLLVAGAGWTKKQGDGAVHAAEAEQLILGFLRKAQASLGSSKSLVDQSGEGEAVLSCLTI